MRYLVKAKLKQDKSGPLMQAIRNSTLGRGSVAGGEYIRNMCQARQLDDGTVTWVEPYWEEYFEPLKIKNAHARDKCQDLNGTLPWNCSTCDCTEKLEERMESWGTPFRERLKIEE